MRLELRPMMATAVDDPFDDPAWSFEPKWDGVRALAHVDGAVRAISRNGNDITAAYPELDDLAGALPADSVVDGEIVAFGDGRPSFERLQSRMHLRDQRRIRTLAGQVPVVFMAFDLLVEAGTELLSAPLSERRARLEASLAQTDRIRLSPRTPEAGTALFEAAKEQRLEGIVAKRLDSVYEPGRRSRMWRKIKVVHEVDAVVVGSRPGSGGRLGSIGSLVLALYEDGGLTYVGSVGSGFDERSLRAMGELLDHYATSEPPLDASSIQSAGEIAWVRPELVAVVEYREVTSATHLRAPVFKGMRTDKDPSDCTVDQLET